MMYVFMVSRQLKDKEIMFLKYVFTTVVCPMVCLWMNVVHNHDVVQLEWAEDLFKVKGPRCSNSLGLLDTKKTLGSLKWIFYGIFH